MHSYYDEDADKIDWEGIDAAATYIGENCKKWGRINVVQYKEKFGTVRVYCNFGWYDLASFTYPGYVRYKYPWMRYIKLHYLNFLIIPVQTQIYRYFYAQSVKKYPHLTEEILRAADWPEYLQGLGYNYKSNLE